MSAKSIRQALEVALNTWATTNATVIAWQGVEYTPAISTKYVRAALLPADTENPTLGDSFNRKSGIFQLLLYFPDGGGMGSSETLADSLLNYFARSESFTSGGIVVRMLESPSINPSFTDGGWLVTPVSIRYTADIF